MRQFIEAAYKEAKLGIRNGDGGPFGAVIAKGGSIVGRGHNMVVKNNDPTAHAEIVAIRDACKNLGIFDLTGCILYSTGRPCTMCYSASMWANIQQIIYVCDYDHADNVGFRDTMISNSVSQNDNRYHNGALSAEKTFLLFQECENLYQEWMNSEKKLPY